MAYYRGMTGEIYWFEDDQEAFDVIGDATRVSEEELVSMIEQGIGSGLTTSCDDVFEMDEAVVVEIPQRFR